MNDRRLTARQLQQYQDDGYLIIESLFSTDEVAELTAAMHSLLTAYRRGDRNPDIGFDPWHTEDGTGDALNPNRIIYMNDLHLLHPRLDAHMRSPKIAAVFCDLWDDDIKSWQSATVLKPPGDHSEYRGWHQDMPDYVPLTNDRNGCIIVYLDHMGPDTGGTSLVPGSHKGPLLERTYERVEGWPEKMYRRSMAGFDEAEQEVVVPEFSPGDALFFHSSIFHKANDNMEDRSKIGLINVYQAADCFDIEGRNQFKASELPITSGRGVLTTEQSFERYAGTHSGKSPATPRQFDSDE